MPTSAEGQRIELNLSNDLLASLDKWRGQQADRPSRAEAVGRLLERALGERTAQSITPAQLTTENDI